MSEADDGPVGTREVAHRLFAAEFDDSDFSYSESDEERAPNYVVTPTGARVNRLFLVGVLTEIERVNEEVLRARVVDPTGPFVVYAGQYQPDELAFLEAAEPPMFVAVTGKARTFEPEDGDRIYTSVRPESVSEVDAATRDRWVVQAAEQTVERIGRMAAAKETGLGGADLRESLRDSGVPDALAAGIPLALDHYGTTGQYLDDLRSLALDAARVVSGDLDEVPSVATAPDEGGDDRVPVLADLDVDAEAGSSSAEPVATAGAGDQSGDSSPGSDDGTESHRSAEPDGADATDAETTAASTDSQSGGATADRPDSGGTDDAGGDGSGVASTGDEGGDPTAAGDVADFDEAGEIGDFDEGGLDAAEDEGDGVGDFDTEFELDEDEREEIESEFGTDFQSGTEVDEPGTADIETPDPEELADAAESGAPADAADADPAPGSAGAPAGDESPSPDADAATSDARTETPETPTAAAADEVAGADDDPADEAAEPAPDVNLEDAVMDAMADLDDGSGADREELQATVAENHGADPDAVADAIQDALMGGRCYEPDDGKLKPI